MIRGKYDLSPREKEAVTAIVAGVLKTLDTIRIDEVSLTEFDIAPCHVYDAIRKLGWEQDNYESSGWEGDTWYYFSHPNYKYTIVMFYCGYTFELKMYRGDKNV